MTKGELLRAVRQAIRNSDLIRLPAETARALISSRTRAVDQKLRAALESNGNTSSDWSKVRVAAGFDPSRVRNCTFAGEVTLGRFDSEGELAPSVRMPSGVYNARVVNSVIGDNALIADTKLVANYLVGRNATLFANGVLYASPPCCFGTGRNLSVAVETGERDVKVFAEITVATAARMATSHGDKAFVKAYESLVASYVKEISGARGFIGEGVVLRNCPKVQDAFIGPRAVVDGATLIENSSLLSSAEEATRVGGGALVVDSILQWGCHVDSMAIIQSSVLCEHSGAERHGKVTESILGPNTSVGEGEVTASLVGPFVGFHHQALLIAAFWPEGKGNVAYGTNVGSNHTSRLPDQEIRPGEGAFFGLGANIKFPSDLSRAPYTIIATGVTTLPQKVFFPFSLINVPTASLPSISPGYNEIVPAWVLDRNIFMVMRNEHKYITRNRAKRLKFSPEVFRPEIVDMMVYARKELMSVGGKEVYSEEDIPGLGKNYLLEENRTIAIKAYRFYIQYYGLLGLFRELEQLASKGKKIDADFLQAKSKNRRWEHERRVLLRELAQNSMCENLDLFVAMERKIARDILSARQRDDVRGARIIEDYAEAHTPAKKDAFVRTFAGAAQSRRKRIKTLLQLLSPCDGKR
jgi:hypothetical protein